MTAEEQKREKARQLRYKKPMVKNINIDFMQEELWDIIAECDNVKWYFEDGEDTLLNALDGDEEQEIEFKMMFADLCAECEQMQSDLEEAYLPECFNDLFVAAGGADYGGGLLGWDSYEGDYYGLECTECFAENESQKRLLRLSKKDLINNMRWCLKILYAYLGIKNRYDSLKAALDILRDENTGYLQMVKQIDELYSAAEKEDFWEWKESTRKFNAMLDNLPARAWIE